MSDDRPQAPIEQRLGYSPAQRALKLLSDSMHRARALRKPFRYMTTDTDDFGTPREIDRDHIPFGALRNFRIALLPTCVVISDGGTPLTKRTREAPYRIPELHKRSFDHFDLYVGDVESTNYVRDVKEWCKCIRDRVEQALAGGTSEFPIRFIVFGELSFPNFWPGHSKGPNKGPDRRRQLARLRKKLDEFLQEKAEKHHAVIISGSCHDPTTFENLATIYFPKDKDSTTHIKLTTAQAVGEYVRIPRNVFYPVYHIGALTFCVLICSDAFDLNIYFEQIWSGSGSLDIKPLIYFVPSYHLNDDPGKKHALARACEQLSVATGTTVVFLNQGYDPDCATVFTAGQQQKCPSEDDPIFVDVDWEQVKEKAHLTFDIRQDLRGVFHLPLRSADPPPQNPAPEQPPSPEGPAPSE